MSDEQPDALNTLSDVIDALNDHRLHCEAEIARTKAHTSPSRVNESALDEEVRTLRATVRGLETIRDAVNALIMWADAQPKKSSSIPDLPDLL